MPPMSCHFLKGIGLVRDSLSLSFCSCKWKLLGCEAVTQTRLLTLRKAQARRGKARGEGAPWGWCRGRTSFQPQVPFSNLCSCSHLPSPYQPGTHPYLGQTTEAYLKLCPNDSTVPFLDTPSL